MKSIEWAGRSDSRYISKENFEQFGLTGVESLVFPRHKAVQVNDKVYDLLMDKAQVFGKFRPSKDVAQEPETLDIVDADPSVAQPSKRSKAN